MMMMILHVMIHCIYHDDDITLVRHGRQDNHATNHVRCAKTSMASLRWHIPHLYANVLLMQKLVVAGLQLQQQQVQACLQVVTGMCREDRQL
jgi:hypothetical protein